MKKHTKILILKMGTTNPPVVKRYGDYDDWFQSSLSEYPIQWHIIDAYTGAPLPNPEDFDGILITGSPSSVWEKELWMLQTVLYQSIVSLL